MSQVVQPDLAFADDLISLTSTILAYIVSAFALCFMLKIKTEKLHAERGHEHHGEAPVDLILCEHGWSPIPKTPWERARSSIMVLCKISPIWVKLN